MVKDLLMVKSDDRTAGYQQWRKLAFLHWRVDAATLQPLIPSSLTVEQYDGSAWLGLVPFSMERIRPWWSPPVPGISWFLETNVRTYVVDKRGVKGVWFFSLDADSRLAVAVARTVWHLPYQTARLSLTTGSSDGRMSVQYEGQRLDSPPADYTVSVSVRMDREAAPAAPGTLDHFLVERYILFAQKRDGRLLSGEVHHHPYQLRPVESCRVSQSLTGAMGCSFSGVIPDHVTWSDGVDVRVSPLTTLQNS